MSLVNKALKWYKISLLFVLRIISLVKYKMMKCPDFISESKTNALSRKVTLRHGKDIHPQWPLPNKNAFIYKCSYIRSRRNFLSEYKEIECHCLSYLMLHNLHCTHWEHNRLWRIFYEMWNIYFPVFVKFIIRKHNMYQISEKTGWVQKGKI